MIKIEIIFSAGMALAKWCIACDGSTFGLEIVSVVAVVDSPAKQFLPPRLSNFEFSEARLS